jgi:hypothetical protein
MWGRIVEVAEAGAGPDGTLRRLAYRSGSSMDDGAGTASATDVDWETPVRTDFAYCSASRPAYAFPDGESGLVVHHLNLFDLGGYQMASAKLYGMVCHDLPVELPSPQTLRELGYRPGTRSDQARAAGPEALLRP